MNEFINIYLKRYKSDKSGNSRDQTVSNINYTNNVSLALNAIPSDTRTKSGKNMVNRSQKQYPDIQTMYAGVSNSLDHEGRVLMNQLYKHGKLFSRDSNDGSSTLENLYTILSEPRLPIFNKKNILKSTLKTLDDPYLVTQNIGVIPRKMVDGILKTENTRILAKMRNTQAKGTYNPEDFSGRYPLEPRDLLNIHSATCPAASIEFNLADRRPAEFTRYVEGFTSPRKSAKTAVKYSELSPYMMEGLSAMVDQHADFKPLDWETVEVTIKPDENAYLRADIQEDHRAKNTRSMIDVLMQSAFMQLGSRQTYNSLIDKRSRDVGGGEGLNQFEIAFVESIVDSNSKKIPVVYMELDDDLTKVLNYTYSFEETKKHFLDSLDQGKNIITGFLIDVNKNGDILTPQGHEILLTGYKFDKKGDLWFKYNDTDDGDYFAPSWVKAESFIPKVHHANVPQNVLGKLPEQPPIGFLYLQEYKALNKQKKNTNPNIAYQRGF